MDLTPYIETLGNEFGLAADAGGPEARALAERLAGQLESAIRLTMLEILSAAGDEITRELAPGSVHVRLRGRDPAFVVTSAAPAFAPEPMAPPAPAAAVPMAPARPAESDDGATTRINLRLPDQLKAAAEAAAAAEHLSVNAWLVRAVAAALESPAPASSPPPDSGSGSGRGERFSGWVR